MATADRKRPAGLRHVVRRLTRFFARPAGTAAAGPAETDRLVGLHSIYPLRFAPTALEEQAVQGACLPGVCPVCGRQTVFDFPPDYARTMGDALDGLGQERATVGPGVFLLRETGPCRQCGAVNRERQVAYFLNVTYGLGRPIRFPDNGFTLLNGEASGVLHAHLARNKGYRCSEFFGPGHAPGELVNGVRHEDFQALSLPDNSLDLVITRDVFEHIPDPYQAHREVWRVLKPGGRHVFTVPFYDQAFEDEVRACRDADGQTRFLLPPLYHLNPVNPAGGSLVYTIFSLETLLKLSRLGFLPRLWHLYDPQAGILGPNALVLEACKLAGT